jgi:hypothetical protein
MKKKKRINRALDNLAWASVTFRKRGKVYGDTYVRHGPVMAAIYPHGLTLLSPEDFAKFGVVNMIVSKICRYTARGNTGHADSAHDLIVYGAMLEELT